MVSADLHVRFLSVIRSIICIVSFAIRTVLAQNSGLFFNELNVQTLPYRFERGVLFNYPSGNASPGIVRYNPMSKEFFVEFVDDSSVSFSMPIKIDTSIDTLFIYNISDGSIGIGNYSNQNKSLSLWKMLPDGEMQKYQTVNLSNNVEKIFVFDINNDRNDDVLYTFANSPGIFTLISSKDGVLRSGKELLPENYISTLTPVYLNNDFLVDIIAYDWVRSELRILYGIGRVQFLEQTILPVANEIKTLTASKKFRDRTIKIAAVLQRFPVIQLWEGDELGEIHLIQSITFSFQPLQSVFADLDNDGNDELIVLQSTPSVSVFKCNAAGRFSLQCEYGLETDNGNLFVQIGKNNSFGKMYFWDKKKQQVRRFSKNIDEIVFADTLLLPLAPYPADIQLADINRNGCDDIVVIHSKKLTIMYGAQFLLPQHQQLYPLTDMPRSLKLYAYKEHKLQAVLTYPLQKAVSVMILEFPQNVREILIPTEGVPTLLAQHQAVSYIGVLNERKNKEIISMSLFETLEKEQFVERTFRLLPPVDFVGADLADLNFDGYPDVLYAYRYRDSNYVQLGVAFGDAVFSMKERMVIPSLKLPDSKNYFMWLYDFNDDNRQDVLFYIGEPWHQLCFLEGNDSTFFSNPSVILSGVIIETRDHLRVFKRASNQHKGFVLTIPRENKILFCEYNPEKGFRTPQTKYQDDGIGNCALGDVDGDGNEELLVLYPNKHMVKIIKSRTWFYH